MLPAEDLASRLERRSAPAPRQSETAVVDCQRRRRLPSAVTDHCESTVKVLSYQVPAATAVVLGRIPGGKLCSRGCGRAANRYPGAPVPTARGTCARRRASYALRRSTSGGQSARCVAAGVPGGRGFAGAARSAAQGFRGARAQAPRPVVARQVRWRSRWRRAARFGVGVFGAAWASATKTPRAPPPRVPAAEVPRSPGSRFPRRALAWRPQAAQARKRRAPWSVAWGIPKSTARCRKPKKVFRVSKHFRFYHREPL
jgi:hypothetical protein